MHSILITGASSGLGAALALALAKPGVTLTLWGRNAARLETTARQCRERGATVHADAFDLRDTGSLPERIRAADLASPIGLAIFNAGVGGSASRSDLAEPVERAHEIATVNFTAAVVGATAIAECMAERKSGRIALIGSVAGSFPLPMAPTYSGAKAGLAMFAEALGLRMRRHGVAVTMIAPGFVDTPMSQSLTEPRPFMLTADQAAATIIRGLQGTRSRMTFPWQFRAITRLVRLLPRSVCHFVLQRL